MYESSQAPPRLLKAVGMACALLLVAACASTPPPSEALRAAEQAISNAERAEAAQYAAAELGEARTRLVSANEAVKEEKMVVAQQLAEQARVEAELAAARAEAVKAGKVNEEMKRGNDALVEETQRNSGAPR